MFLAKPIFWTLTYPPHQKICFEGDYRFLAKPIFSNNDTNYNCSIPATYTASEHNTHHTGRCTSHPPTPHPLPTAPKWLLGQNVCSPYHMLWEFIGFWLSQYVAAQSTLSWRTLPLPWYQSRNTNTQTCAIRVGNRYACWHKLKKIWLGTGEWWKLPPGFWKVEQHQPLENATPHLHTQEILSCAPHCSF